MVLTQEKDISNYLATIEAVYRSTEVQLFNILPAPVTHGLLYPAVQAFQAAQNSLLQTQMIV